MTDRRSRQPQRCAVRGCVFVGHWLDGHCPEHRSEAAVARAVAQRTALAAEMQHSTISDPTHNPPQPQ